MDIVSARRSIRERRYIGGSRVRENDYFAFGGGLNIVDAPLEVPPGELLGGQNYEPYYDGGYRRVDGYERFDGRPRPSDASYWIVDFDTGVLANYPSVGDTVNGQTSGATGKLLTLVRRNMHQNSQDAGSWTEVINATVTSNAIAGPDTVVDADKLIEDTSDDTHGLRQRVIFALADLVTWSCYLKAAERSVVNFRAAEFGDDQTTYIDSYVDLARGGNVKERTLGSAPVTVERLDQDWWRLSGSFKVGSISALATEPIDFRVILLPEVGSQGQTTVYTGDGTSGLYVVGAQIEFGTAVGDLHRTAGGESGSVILGRLTGTFTDNENLREVAVVFGVADGVEAENGAPDPEPPSDVALAHDDTRADIAVVPGHGPVRGVIQFGATAYAIRNDVGDAAATLYKSTTSGRTAVPLGRKLRFDAGSTTTAIKEGDTITGAVSGATGVVKRVGLKDGSWGGSPGAVGWVIFSSVIGLYQDNEGLMVSAVQLALANGADFAQALAPNGNYEFRIHNFYGHVSTKRLYGVSGVDFAFELSADEVFAEIETGMVTDTPTHLAVHRGHLFFLFPGGSLQYSSLGLPLEWRVIVGAGEIALGDEGVGMLEEIGDQLFVFARNKTHILAGTTSADFNLGLFSFETGGIERTLQRIGQGIILDDRGFTSIAATDRFGNYASNSFSNKVAPLVAQLKTLGVRCSVISRRLNLYRIYFEDGVWLVIGVIGAKINGIMGGKLPIFPFCSTSAEDATGREVVLVGADDGFVYEFDPPNPPLSFDGLPIESFLRPVFYHSKSPSRNKHYRAAAFDITTENQLSVKIGVEYSFAERGSDREPLRSLELQGGGGFWNVAIWNEFKWSVGVVAEVFLKLDGNGKNIGFVMYSKTAIDASHVFSGVNMLYSQRRLIRSRGS